MHKIFKTRFTNYKTTNCRDINIMIMMKMMKKETILEHDNYEQPEYQIKKNQK